MRNRLLPLILTGGLAYIITIIIGLLLRQPLQFIFFKGIAVLLVVSLASWLGMLGLEKLVQNSQQNKDKLRTVPDENTADQGEEDVFAPLNPPILEITEDEND